MYLKDYFFYIHYCNGRKLKDSNGPRRRITRTLQHHELILATGGSGSITIDGRKYQVQPGMLFYIAPGLLHTFELSGEDLPYVMTVHFNYAFVTHTDGRLDISNEAPILTIPSGQQLKDYYLVEELFKKLVDTWHAKGLGYEFMTKTLLQQLLIALWQNIRKQDQIDASSLKIEKIIVYMQQNLSKKITLQELANQVLWSPTYLSRTFKGITGYAVIEFFNKMKIDQAKELMLESDKKIREVAQAVGYTDEFYFSRMFKKIEGMSPSEFYSKNVHGD
ncbi:AraC family transcriptional regulator [Paenibacillus guangzhouensis]|uniref:AraC family transcriptional regulator n=1 Tax=Paenibacillus guangzhouensis TaxID=1473112 RepID=UPI00126696D7|nr:AraC family transcriptional regulator [Paenibacillus guangzhouensis]